MNLKHLTDKALLKDTHELVKEERENLTKVLHHIREIDRRKLYADLNCSSIYDYCTRELKYSVGAAHRRITAARLLSEVPEIEAKIENGLLNLCGISDVGRFIRENSIKSPEEKKEILEKVQGLSKKDGERILGELTNHPKKPMTTVFIYHDTFLKLERVRHLTGKKSADEIVDYMSDLTVDKIEKEKFKVKSLDSFPPVEMKRKIPASLKGAIYRRDKKCIQCGSLSNLNYDHRIPFSVGGKTNLENVRLLCANCNQRARIRMGLMSPSGARK